MVIAQAQNRPFHTVLPIWDLVSDLDVNDLVQDAILHQHNAAIPTGLHALSQSKGYFPIEGDITLTPDGMRGCIATFRDIAARLSADAPSLICSSPFQNAIDHLLAASQEAAYPRQGFEWS
jgi:hypothetical protein